MVETRASSTRQTRSTSKDTTKKLKATPNSSRRAPAQSTTTGLARRTKNKGTRTTNAPRSATSSRVSMPSTLGRTRPNASSSAEQPARASKRSLPTLASTRSRRGSVVMPVAEPMSPRNVSSLASVSPPPSRSLRKRKVKEVEVLAPPAKRQRANAGGGEETDVRSIAERLQAQDQALRTRDAELNKREAALWKLEKKMIEKDEKVAKRLKHLRDEKAAIIRKAEKLGEEMEALTATITALRKSRERNEEATASSTSSRSRVDTEWVFAQLEDQFQCSLCFEVMACPYQLHHGRCGHTFCALCLLRWCFAAVHRGCGYWHDALECPLCRAELPYTPDVIPRQMCTFPFVPCRLGDTILQTLLDILQDTADAAFNDDGASTGVNQVLDDRIVAWSRNGNARVDWEARDSRGRTEMAMLAKNWQTLDGEDFIAFKDRLESQ